MTARTNNLLWTAAAGLGFAAAVFAGGRLRRRAAGSAQGATLQTTARDKNREDTARAGRSDDVMGVRHGGGRDQYGGSFGGGQSGGGAYANPHTGTAPGQGGNRYGSQRGSASTTGGQSAQGYYGGGQLGDRNYSDHSHAAASTAGGPEHGSATYQTHASQRGGPVDDTLAASVRGAGFDEHQGFGAEHQGQRAQGIEHGGPHIDPDPEPGRKG